MLAASVELICPHGKADGGRGGAGWGSLPHSPDSGSSCRQLRPSPAHRCSPPALFLCSNSSPTHPHPVEALPVGSDVSVCAARGSLSLGRPRAGTSRPLSPQHLLPSASIQDAQQWLHRNRFSQFCRLFASFSGECLQTHRGLANTRQGCGFVLVTQSSVGHSATPAELGPVLGGPPSQQASAY